MIMILILIPVRKKVNFFDIYNIKLIITIVNNNSIPCCWSDCDRDSCSWRTSRIHERIYIWCYQKQTCEILNSIILLKYKIIQI